MPRIAVGTRVIIQKSRNPDEPQIEAEVSELCSGNHIKVKMIVSFPDGSKNGKVQWPKLFNPKIAEVTFINGSFRSFQFPLRLEQHFPGRNVEMAGAEYYAST